MGFGTGVSLAGAGEPKRWFCRAKGVSERGELLEPPRCLLGDSDLDKTLRTVEPGPSTRTSWPRIASRHHCCGDVRLELSRLQQDAEMRWPLLLFS
mmetsp:Transcript_10995/g.26538  ORF Transcript_10995/g.26538 Transcript_10995/m.26538 type:complete len:96 (-) Transcript_10995:497-784(-)